MNNCGCQKIYPDERLDYWEVSCSVPYYTKAEIDEIISGINVSGVTEEELNEAITSAMTEIEAEIPSLSGYSTTDEMNDAITEATSGKANSDDVYLKTDTSGKTELEDEFVKYYLKTETSSKTEIDDALALKADPYTAGRAIDINSANTISFTLPISAGTGSNAIIEGSTTTGSGAYSHAEGYATKATNTGSHSEGMGTVASGGFAHAEGRNTTASQIAAHAEGSNTVASATDTHAEGNNTKATNDSEHASGQFNVSHKENNTFGGSGNTLFSIGNGTANNARHNAFEIMQNGDIYISSGGTDVKLQDVIGQGGGSDVTSGDVQTMINQSISGKTNNSDFSAHTANTAIHLTSGNIQTQIDSSISGKVDYVYCEYNKAVGETGVYGYQLCNHKNDSTVEKRDLFGIGNGLKNVQHTAAGYNSLDVDTTATVTSGSTQIPTSNAVYNAVSTKADSSDVYLKTEVYNKTEVNNIVSNKMQCLSEAEWSQISGSTQPNTLYLVY